jgi:hypothetical protein
MASVSQSILRNSGLIGPMGGWGGAAGGFEAAVDGAGAPWGGRDLEFIVINAFAGISLLST